MRGGGERWAGTDVTTASSLTRPSDGRSAARSEAVSQNQRQPIQLEHHMSHSCHVARCCGFFFLLSPSMQKGRQAAQSLFFPTASFMIEHAFSLCQKNDFPANISQWCQFFFLHFILHLASNIWNNHNVMFFFFKKNGFGCAFYCVKTRRRAKANE